MKATVKCRLAAIRHPDPNKVLISIGSYGYHYEPVPHPDDWKDILTLAFDDVVPQQIDYDPRILDVPMTIDQAKDLHDFIMKHLGEEFVIHCDAGISRSAAVGAYLEKYHGYEIEYHATGDSRDKFKNIHVFNLLGRIDYHSAFGDIE